MRDRMVRRDDAQKVAELALDLGGKAFDWKRRALALEAEVARLRAALRPFATLRDQVDGEADDALACPSVPDCQGYALVWADEADGDRVQLTAGQLRRARAAYKGENKS